MSGGIQCAAQGTADYVSAALDNAPVWARDAINRARQARGLSPVLGRREYARLDAAAAAARAAAEADEARRVAVWVKRPDGKLERYDGRKPAPARGSSSLTTSRTAQRQGGRGPLLQARVLIMPTYGLAAAGDVRRQLDERVAPGAFGPAADLNAPGAWTLRSGHNGVLLALPGDRLRAIDTPAGLVAEWVPNFADPWQQQAVHDLEAGHTGVSVMMRAVQRRTVRVPSLHELVTSATLQHIALLQRGGTRPCYPAAGVLVVRNVWRDDTDELQKHIARLIAECRSRANRLGQ